MTYAIESNGYVSNIIMQQYEVVILENAKELGRYLLNNVPFHCFRTNRSLLWSLSGIVSY